jgi:transposase
MTRRFRHTLFESVHRGAAHAEVARDERTTRYQVQMALGAGVDDRFEARRETRPARRLSLDEAHHRRGRELATVVSDLDRRRVVEVFDGRSRRRVEHHLRSLPERSRGRSTWSRSSHTRPSARQSKTNCRGRGS